MARHETHGQRTERIQEDVRDLVEVRRRRTNQQQPALLDQRLGVGVGAGRERGRLTGKAGKK